jgi:hypothetical protein
MRLEVVRGSRERKDQSDQQGGQERKERVPLLWRRPAALFKMEKPGPAEEGVPASPEKTPLWRVGLIVTASAFCGGIAVVLWNRRLLTRMRDSGEGAAVELGCAWDDNP